MYTELPINTHIDYKENGDEPSSKEVEDTNKFLSMDSNKILDWHRLNFPDFDWRISPRTAALQKKKGKYWGNICFFGCGKHAAYPDEEGNLKRLCSNHAKMVGSHKVLNPCRDCPDDEKLEAHYPDEEGKSNRLCSECAIKAGTHIRSIHGSSIAACEFFDMYKQLTGIDLPHIHYALDQDHPEGQEIKGLVPGRKLRPDSYDKESQTVWLFHGEWYHGFPEWHPKHKSLVSHGRSSVDQWHKTVMDMQAYVDTGYNVKYILHEEYAKTRLVNNPTPFLSCIRDFLVEGVPVS